MKKNYTLDFTDVKHYLEFHKRIQESLEFPDYYGMNYDALWDCLTDFCCETHIIVKGTSTLSKDLTEEAKGVIDIFQEASEKMPYFNYVVED
jgi:RNAse (barnase) inhibitor barstar